HPKIKILIRKVLVISIECLHHCVSHEHGRRGNKEPFHNVCINITFRNLTDSFEPSQMIKVTPDFHALLVDVNSIRKYNSTLLAFFLKVIHLLLNSLRKHYVVGGKVYDKIT